MPTTVQERKTGSPVPEVVCPRCERHMRLAVVEPEGSHNGDQISFDCECGFYYRQSERARQGR
jgi:lysyl-tRNA synthetase class I